MPWSPAQERTLQMIASGRRPSNGAFSNVSREKAKKMAAEGVKEADDKEARRRALRDDGRE